MDSPRISVVIAAKNAAATIGRAVASALRQPQTYEIIVVDDGSTDDTAAQALAADAGGGRVRVIAFAQNRGPSAARNAAIDTAGGELISILDADDFMLDGRFTRLLAYADGSEFLADDLYRSVESAPETITGQLVGGVETPRPINLAAFALANIGAKEQRRELGFLKPLISRAYLDAHRLRYEPGVRLGEDYLLYAAALAGGARFRLTPPCGYVAVERADSLSGLHRTEDLQALMLGAARLEALPDLDPAARAALKANRVSVERRYRHRKVLDVRRQAGVPAALLELVRQPSSLGYILAQTLSDKLRHG